MAGTRFDALQEQVFTAVRDLYGYDATWTPLAGGPAITGKVLLNHPTESENLAGPAGYDEPQWMVEYLDTAFPGLRQSCDTGAVETITIDGTGYHVRSSTLHFDGRTVKLTMSPV